MTSEGGITQERVHNPELAMRILQALIDQTKAAERQRQRGEKK